MIGSGTFSLIKNSELKESIINLYHEYDQKQTLINSNKKWIDEISVIVYTKTDLMEFEGDVGVIFDSPEMIRNDWSFLNEPDDEKFKIVVRGITANAWYLITNGNYYLELRNSCRKLITQIDRELAKPQ